jgi:hypothetical protein
LAAEARAVAEASVADVPVDLEDITAALAVTITIRTIIIAPIFTAAGFREDATTTAVDVWAAL